jgi:hypothetical protein
MKSIIILSSLVLCLSCAGWAHAATNANWARNAEADVASYKVYACQPAGCVPTKTIVTATVPQTTVGVRPSWTLPVNLEGTVAVTAVDLSGNESGLSVAVPFDTKAPVVPTDVQTN